MASQSHSDHCSSDGEPSTHQEANGVVDGSVVEEDEIVWGRTFSESEMDVPPSPSSSGYASERGSSSAATGSPIQLEIEEMRIGDDTDTVHSISDSHTSWLPGKRHVDEDDASIPWRKRKKHFFILSHSGKPIYSRYGDEHKLAGFSATLQAIISFVENGGDSVKLLRAGKHQL